MTRAVIIIRNNDDREKAAGWCRKAPAGTRVEWKAARRSNEQSSKMWAMLTEIAEQVDWYGQKLSPEDFKDIFTAALRRARVVPGLDRGSFVPLGMRTSDMTRQEMSDLLELIAAFGAERGVKFRDLEMEVA